MEWSGAMEWSGFLEWVFLESECMSLKVRSLPENYLKALSIKDHNTCTISK